ncbi:NAD(P)/FAD-dependent oxidoreductase [Ferrimonas marina]|uniref:NADH dehydrogenase n=1 Tax=Ferrimonas marina TaxID=299255 RepID=A0A1M5VT32_9GAMM|nr:NAD(P)/FAD-dependent oxidoreductase [Ferrimonas marina]SHH78350.1 NADH dehydrogenase [Ferrimonas marina]
MRIVIVGGGAGGLGLATQLGRKLGRRGKAEVLLLDRNHTHIWKPLLHEVASGSLDAEVDSVSYRAHGHRNGFQFQVADVTGIDRQRQTVQIAPYCDEQGQELLPAREEAYDYLVMAIGGQTNDFGVAGVAEHCILLDCPQQAQRFHRNLVDQFLRVNRAVAQGDNEQRLHVAIVGGGATGVELSAELIKARQWFATYGLTHLTPDHLKVSLIEAGPRLLPALSERISVAAKAELEKLGIAVHTDTQVGQATAAGLETPQGQQFDCDMMVWAAGVKAPDFLTGLTGLETNRANQLLVEPTLQVQGDERIFALGDCAGLVLGEQDGRPMWVPPRAQSAHQMAQTVAQNLIRKVEQKPLKPFVYKDYGSLVSLSNYTAFGKLMGGIGSGSLSVEGRIARMAYISLYRKHQIAIHGIWRTGLLALSDGLNQWLRPRMKLH